MEKGRIKVMVGKNGTTRVQETLGDRVKIYSANDWAKELEKRREADKKKTEKPKAEKVEEKKEEKPKKTTKKK